MTAASTQVTEVRGDVALRDAYRKTFQEYATKLEAFQQLVSAEVPDSVRIDAALHDVEKARIAHSTARDQLARELVRPVRENELPPAAPVEEHHIRATARLLWEVAGRPEGTAEGDWLRAEQLVRTATACC